MPIYEYKGQTYELADGLSIEEAKQKIESYLSSQPAAPQVTTDPEPVSEPVSEPETEYEGVAQEFFEGVGSGLIAIPQGILELGASVVDLAADTDYASSVTEAANKLRDVAGIDPEGLVGKGAEVVTQFVIPGLGAASAVSKASKLGRLQKAVQSGKGKLLKREGKAESKLTKGETLALGAQQVAAAGAVDAVVATDGATTIADFFEGGPTQTDQEIGLSGREEALRRITNKLAIGAETGLITAVAPAALAGTATVAGKVLTETPILSDAVRGTASGLQQGARTLTRGLDTIEAKRALGQEQGAVANTLADVASVLRYRGYLPEDVAEARLLITGKTDAAIKEARGVLSKLDKEVDKVLKESDKISEGASPLTRQGIFTNIEEFLTAPDAAARNRALGELPENVANQAKSMRGLVQKLNQDVLDSDYMKTLDAQTTKSGKSVGEKVRADIEKNINTYLRRRYQSFEVKNYTPTAEVMAKAVKGFQEDPKAVAEELGKIANTSKGEAKETLMKELGIRHPVDDLEGKTFELIGGAATKDQAERAANHFLKAHTKRSATKGVGISRVAEYKVNPKLFTAKIQLTKYKRELLGEITDPKESFLGTVADLAEFKAVDDYLGRIRNLATETDEAGNLLNPGVASLFRNTEDMTDLQKQDLLDQGFKILDSQVDTPTQLLKADSGSFGSLRGFAVSPAVYRDMTRLIIGDTNVLGNAARMTYSGFLRTKGATQFGKTVLSPITQLRNVTTASLFALAQGNVGRGSNLGESIRLTYNNLFTDVTSEEAAKNFKEMQELGIVGTQAQLRELQDLIQKGLGYGLDEVNGIPAGRKFGSAFTDNKLGSFVGNIGKGAENLYQAGDDVWKIYNFNFEFNKLKNAYRGMADAPSDAVLKQQAARIVRNTVPNYNMAPQLIKTLRRAPVGNFIAFPYEILRTGANTIALGIDELASANANIRKIGLRRLTGAITTFGAMPAAASALAYELSGVTEEQMKAYQRSGAPPWEKNARLLPTGIDKETGLPTYVNYSYSNPYDMLEKIAIAALNSAEQGKRMNKSGAEIVAGAANASLAELFAPFTEEAIITAKIRDVLDPEAETVGVRQLAQFAGGRAGRTITGAKVYNKEDSAGDKLGKSFAHIVDALIPGGAPIDVRSGEFEASRFARGVVNGLGLEELGISSKDRMKRERELSKELARAFSGITENPIESTSLKFKGFEFQKANTNASNIFNAVTNRANASSQDLVDAFRKSTEAKFRVQKEMYNVIEDMRTIGLNDQQIRKVFKDAGIAGYKKLLIRKQGKPNPLFDVPSVGPSARKNMRQNDLSFPREEINQIRDEYRNKTLLNPEPQVEETRTPDLAPSQAQQPVAAAAPPPPAVAQAGAAPAQMAAPAPTSQPDASLLGSNPIDALKNLQIFQRTQ